MIRDMCLQFLKTEVLPVMDRIDKAEPGLMPALMEKAGEQGLLSASVPEEYGGMGKDFVTSTLVSEALGGGYSFSVAMSAHAGIGTLPILYFGTEEQKKKYIPKLATGEWKGVLRADRTRKRQRCVRGKINCYSFCRRKILYFEWAKMLDH